MGPINSQEIQAQLLKIVASPGFVSSERMSRFLRHAVARVLEGRATELKESLLGIEVFDRAADFDARIDPIVRVEARRLRDKLARYYRTEGKDDSIIISLPRGGYAPVFERAGQPAPVPAPQHSLVNAARQKTIAVLPFSNLSAEPENQYFSDGLTRELIHELTTAAGLRVVAWNSVSQLREKAGQAREVGQLLDVDMVLEGGVQRAGNRIRITAQLIEASTGVYVWSQNYQRELDDLFAVQEEMARTISLMLQVKIDHRTQRHGNIAAYNFYLQGRHVWSSRTEVGLRQSIRLFERAIEEDSTCAPAYAGIADAYNLLCDFGHMPAEEGIPLARRAACRALEICPTLSEAYTSLGFILCFHDWNWAEGEDHYRRSIELNPGYVTARHWYACDYLAIRGRFAEAAREILIARQLDPLDAAVEDSCCFLKLLQRRFAEAEQGYRQLIRKAPEFHKSYAGLGRTLGFLGRYAEAVESLEKARSVAGDIPSLMGALGQTHAVHGNKVAARRMLKSLEDMAKRRHVASTCFALIHAGLGENEEALDWLERGAARRELGVSAANVHPAYDALRSEPRFQRLLERMGFKS